MADSWSTAFGAGFGGAAVAAPADLRTLEVWTDVEANGGERESVFLYPLQVVEEREIGDRGHLGRERLTASVYQGENAWPDVQEGKILRVELADDTVTEWRIVEVQRRRKPDGSRMADIQCESIAYDLFRRTPLLERIASNLTSIDFQLMNLTPSEWIDDVILTTTDFPSWITKGTVEATTDVSLRVDGKPAGPVLNSIAEITAHEWTLSRNGGTDYQIDILETRGSASRRPFIGLKRNLLSASHRTTAKEQATRIYPRGSGQEGFRATIGPARWQVTAITATDHTAAASGSGTASGTASAAVTVSATASGSASASGRAVGELVGDTLLETGASGSGRATGSAQASVTLSASASGSASATGNATGSLEGRLTLADPGGGDAPIAFDGQLNGYYLEKTDNTTTEITASKASNDTIIVDNPTGISVNDLVWIRLNAAGDELTFLEDPANKTTYGLRTKTLNRRDLPDVANLVSDVASAFLDTDTDSDGVPDGWSKVGSPTVTQETGAEFHEHGTASAKVVASAGEGLISDPISVSPTAINPHFAAQAFFRADSGTVQVQLIDTTNNSLAYPDDSVKAGVNTELDNFAMHTIRPNANFNDLGTTQMQIQVVARGGSATFYLDAAQLINRSSPAGSIIEGRGPNRLWQAANDELGRVGAPEDSYDVESIDLYGTDVDRYPDDQIELGNTVIVKDPGLSFDVEVRVVGIRRDLNETGDLQLTIDNRRKSLADRLAERQLPELLDRTPPTTGADKTEGNDLSVLNAKFGSFQADAQEGRYVIPGVITDNTSVTTPDVSQGELFVVQFSPAKTFTIQSIAAEHLNGSTNDTQRGDIRLCIYSDSGGYPDTLLYESSDFSVDSDSDNPATDVEATGPIIEVEVGKTYWVGFQCTSSPDDPNLPNMGFWSGGLAVPLGASTQTGTPVSSLKATGQGTSCPGTFPSSSSASFNSPKIGLQV